MSGCTYRRIFWRHTALHSTIKKKKREVCPFRTLKVLSGYRHSGEKKGTFPLSSLVWKSSNIVLKPGCAWRDWCAQAHSVWHATNKLLQMRAQCKMKWKSWGSHRYMKKKNNNNNNKAHWSWFPQAVPGTNPAIVAESARAFGDVPPKPSKVKQHFLCLLYRKNVFGNIKWQTGWTGRFPQQSTQGTVRELTICWHVHFTSRWTSHSGPVLDSLCWSCLNIL